MQVLPAARSLPILLQTWLNRPKSSSWPSLHPSIASSVPATAKEAASWFQSMRYIKSRVHATSDATREFMPCGRVINVTALNCIRIFRGEPILDIQSIIDINYYEKWETVYFHAIIIVRTPMLRPAKKACRWKYKVPRYIYTYEQPCQELKIKIYKDKIPYSNSNNQNFRGE
jgi:hypothetical protein